MYIKQRLILLLAFFLMVFQACKNKVHTNDYKGWQTYGGSKDASRYSGSDQINRNNVSQLKEVWRYSSGDKDAGNHSQNQCNPIIVDGHLYGSTPTLKLFSLDAQTGKQHWVFDPAKLDTSNQHDPNASMKVNRGVVYWADHEGNNKRIFYNVGDRIYAVNAENGTLIKGFPRRATWISNNI
jgi:quinoprotein glucose dehydrogenase